MAQRVYKLFLAQFTEAWHQLSQEQQNDLLAKVGQALEKAGGKSAIPVCNSSWSNEHWRFFGVEEFPDAEAVQKHNDMLNELNWFRYVDSMSALGTEFHQ